MEIKTRPMTPSEKRLFKEAIIQEYKTKNLRNNQNPFNDFIKYLRKITPINLTIGIIACIILVYLKGWKALFETIITATIWITVVSAVLSSIAKPK